MHVVRCNVGRGQAIVEQFSPLQTLNQDLLWWLKQYWYYKTKQYLNNQNMELVYCWYTLYGKQCLMWRPFSREETFTFLTKGLHSKHLTSYSTSAVCQLFIFRFFFLQNCLQVCSTQCLLQNLNYLLFVHIL